jgi:hypothetical protein
MKRFIIFSLCQLIIFITPFSQLRAAEPAASDSVNTEYAAGTTAGKAAAKNYSGHFLWGVGGFMGGLFLLGPVGTGIVAGVSQIGTPAPPFAVELQIADSTEAYRVGFGDGYAKRIESRNLVASLIGGAIGTAVLTIIVISAVQQMESEPFMSFGPMN